ncbi:hypothetical protein AAMO2058_000537200 [Amorphochlora amoebiformis]
MEPRPPWSPRAMVTLAYIVLFLASGISEPRRLRGGLELTEGKGGKGNPKAVAETSNSRNPFSWLGNTCIEAAKSLSRAFGIEGQRKRETGSGDKIEKGRDESISIPPLTKSQKRKRRRRERDREKQNKRDRMDSRHKKRDHMDSRENSRKDQKKNIRYFGKFSQDEPEDAVSLRPPGLPYHKAVLSGDPNEQKERERHRMVTIGRNIAKRLVRINLSKGEKALSKIQTDLALHGIRHHDLGFPKFTNLLAHDSAIEIKNLYKPNPIAVLPKGIRPEKLTKLMQDPEYREYQSFWNKDPSFSETNSSASNLTFVIDGANVARKYGLGDSRCIEGLLIVFKWFDQMGYKSVAFLPNYWLNGK